MMQMQLILSLIFLTQQLFAEDKGVIAPSSAVSSMYEYASLPNTIHLKKTTVEGLLSQLDCTNVKLGRPTRIRLPTIYGFSVESENCILLKPPAKCPDNTSPRWLNPDQKDYLVCVTPVAPKKTSSPSTH